MPRAAAAPLAYRAGHGAVHHPRHRAARRTAPAILIFVSLAERYARIIADDGIARVPQPEWQGAVDALVAHMREDRVADGFVAAIDLAAPSWRRISRAPRPTATSCPTGST